MNLIQLHVQYVQKLHVIINIFIKGIYNDESGSISNRIYVWNTVTV